MGYGWLGKQVVDLAIGNQLQVLVLSRQKPKNSKIQVQEYAIQDTEFTCSQELLQSNAIVFTIPPSASEKFTERIELLAKNLMTNNYKGRFIFISSTSVFGKRGEFYDNSTLCPESDNAKKLAKIERFLLENKGLNSLVIRPGGLVGIARHPVKFLSGRINLEGGQDPVNLVHGEDLAAFILFLAKSNATKSSYNFVCDEHPSKQIYYPSVAMKLNIALPRYKDEKTNSAKVVHADKWKELNFEMKYNSPFKFPLPIE